MQTTPGASPSRLPLVLTVVALVLAVIGVGGAFAKAGKSSKKLASTSATTTTALGTFDTGLPGQTTTTAAGAVPGATATTAKGTTATTAKPGSTTATTSLDGAGSCAVPAASTSDPGAQQAPALGTYTYDSCTDASDTTDIKIAAGQSSNGVTRRDVTETAGGLTQTATEAYGPNGVYQEVLTIKTGFADIKCDWNPDVLLFPTGLTVGKSWSVDSKCTVTNPQAQGGQTTLHLTATAKITGRVNDVIGGTTVNAWVVDGNIHLETPNGAVDEQEHDHYDPTRGISVYRHATSSSSQGSITRIDHLKSLTPKS